MRLGREHFMQSSERATSERWGRPGGGDRWEEENPERWGEAMTGCKTERE